jgi:predicted RNase H-like HicB family nuclease
MTSYIALLFKDLDSDYGVAFPDFPGCITAGRTQDEARRMAAEVLAFHVSGMRTGGEPIPEPSTLDTIMADPENREAFGFIVEVPDPPGRAQRINVTLPEDLIKAIDRTSKNRSRFLAEAARERLARIKT